jgi:hypothetical protein
LSGFTGEPAAFSAAGLEDTGGEVVGGAEEVGTGDGAGHTLDVETAGGFGWEPPSSPEPQDQPCTAPSPTRVDPAPEVDQVQLPFPSPIQKPQKSGYFAKQSLPEGPTPAS